MIDKLSILDYTVVVSSEPFAPQAAQRLARAILDSGRTVFSGHALDAMKDDDLSTTYRRPTP
jgi:hypothetical protein